MATTRVVGDAPSDVNASPAAPGPESSDRLAPDEVRRRFGRAVWSIVALYLGILAVVYTLVYLVRGA